MNNRIRINGKLYEAVNETVNIASGLNSLEGKLRRVNKTLSDAADEAEHPGLDSTDITNAFSYVDSFLRDLEY